MSRESTISSVFVERSRVERGERENEKVKDERRGEMRDANLR